MNLPNLKDHITEILALIITVLSFAFLFSLLIIKVPNENKDITNITIGFVLGSFVAGVAGYYFGSSKQPKP
jgi:uncharacterized BrkB/YihY/UPF0761 family membrane protein